MYVTIQINKSKSIRVPYVYAKYAPRMQISIRNQTPRSESWRPENIMNPVRRLNDGL